MQIFKDMGLQTSESTHTFYIGAVSEIKGAPCTRGAHFHGRVHDFRRCAASSVCTFLLPFIVILYIQYIKYNIILGGCMDQFPDAQFYGKCTLRVHKIKA